MKIRAFCLLVLGVCLTGLVSGALAQTPASADGHWEGVIQMSTPETGKSQDLGITVDIAKNAEGGWIGSMAVLKSSSIDVPLTSISIEGTLVQFTANLPGRAFFRGVLSKDSSSLSGTASNAAGQAPFQLTRKGEANVKTPPPSSALSKEFEGIWEGHIEAGGKVRRIALKLWAASDGTAMAVLISVDKGNLEIPITTVTITGKRLQLDARSVSGTYQGTLGNAGAITGVWNEGNDSLPLSFQRVERDEKTH